MNNIPIDIIEVNRNNYTSNLVSSLLNKETDLVQINNFITEDDAKNVIKRLDTVSSKDADNMLTLPDGYFYPLPYSSIRQDHVDPVEAMHNYNKANASFLNNFSNDENCIKNVIGLIEKLNNLKPLEINDAALSPLNLRVLYSQKNGIDIHCENAFLNQLSSGFKSSLSDQIDLENALSIFITLQAPEDGGELILFNKNWDSTQINVNETTYEERHDINGSIFENRGFHFPKYVSIRPPQYSAIIFRAAQIWHSIDFIKGQRKRITIGCFIAKGNDGNTYYWA